MNLCAALPGWIRELLEIKALGLHPGLPGAVVIAGQAFNLSQLEGYTYLQCAATVRHDLRVAGSDD